MSKLSRIALAALLLLPACGSDDEEESTSSISVRTYGESFIEEGIPVDDVDDGWAISFNAFDVSFRDIVVAGVALADPEPIDISRPSLGKGHALGTVAASTGAHGDPSFTLSRVELAGSAEKAGVEKTFSWVFDSPTKYTRCETSTVVAEDLTAVFQITVHADHLFYDSLVSETPQLLFQPLADADTDDDGEITQAELAQVDIGAYDPGNEDVDDLWSFLVAQSRTLGHVDGEGHCQASADD